MTIDPVALAELRFPEREVSYSRADAALYAIAIGLGDDPMDPAALRFVMEERLCVVPTLVTAAAWNADWIHRTGVNVSLVLHSQQSVAVQQPLAPEGRWRLRHRIARVADQGPGRGAVLVFETRVFDATSGEDLCTTELTAIARGEGGFGGAPDAAERLPAVPHRECDRSYTFKTRPEQALLYRLTGDRNPLHVDPEFAGKAGYARPILHGLCTYGIGFAAALRTFCGDRVDRVSDFSARFTSPVTPGDTLRTDLWIERDEAALQVVSVERGKVVLDAGRVKLR